MHEFRGSERRTLDLQSDRFANRFLGPICILGRKRGFHFTSQPQIFSSIVYLWKAAVKFRMLRGRHQLPRKAEQVEISLMKNARKVGKSSPLPRANYLRLAIASRASAVIDSSSRSRLKSFVYENLLLYSKTSSKIYKKKLPPELLRTTQTFRDIRELKAKVRS